MKNWVDEQMPNFIEPVRDKASFDKFQAKATKHGLPQAILFTSKAKTSPLTKYLSTEFRRRLLLGEVYPTKSNKDIMSQFGVKDLPALIVIPPEQDASPVVYEGDGLTRNKLVSFLSKYALKEKVVPKTKEETEQKDEPKREVKEEL